MPDVDITGPHKPTPELDLVPLAKLTRIAVQRLAPFCQIRLSYASFFFSSHTLHLICILRNDVPQVPLVHKTNNKILQLIQAVDVIMLVAQLGYRISSDAASMCDPFTPSTITTATSNGSRYLSGLSVPEVLQTMAAHGHGHCLRALETFRDVQQRIYRVRHWAQFN